MITSPSKEDFDQAIREKSFYCRIHSSCDFDYCCYFCSEEKKCYAKCDHYYWQVCNERINESQIVWVKIFDHY